MSASKKNYDNIVRNSRSYLYSKREKFMYTDSERPTSFVRMSVYFNVNNSYFLVDSQKIYTAFWNDGSYDKWDTMKQRLTTRFRNKKVVFKKLENVESANRSWFEETRKEKKA
ncbi:hypothetical protein RhiirC2_849859 [Rhizophagus irregularis]|uniref:Uncharacterized protein n=1 Tax=Rhizophagus irregularis TaxID=588596 RepID=A0A2N1N9C1_9GLOM|nr:hypothetical protein RhiirC2_849859 [Rhizophagus irregularis]